MVHEIRVGAMTAGLLAALSAPLSPESITLTTYYPAPAGIYQKMTTTGDTLLARDGSGVAVGASAAPTAPTKLAVMGGNVNIGNAAPANYAKLDVNTSGGMAVRTMDGVNGGLLIGYNGPTIQARTTADANTADLSLQAWGGNVRIGLAGTNPASLSVAGNAQVVGSVQLGDDAASCIAAKAGAQRWHASSLQVCDGSAWVGVGGGFQVPDDAAACVSGKAGTLRWHLSSLELCDGAAWGPLGGTGTPGTNAGSCANPQSCYQCSLPVWPATSCTCPQNTSGCYTVGQVVACASGWGGNPISANQCKKL